MKYIATLLILFSVQAFGDYTFVSAPRGDRASETKKYAPVAEELSKLLGVTVRYKYVEGWSPYTKGIYDDKYDFVFDGPHYVSFRQTYREHKVIARLLEPLAFVVIVKSDSKYSDIKSLAGRPSCLHPSPNLATTLFLNNYSYSPPATVRIEGFQNAFAGVVNGDCVSAVMTVGALKKLNVDNSVKVIHEFAPLPNQALTASSRIPDEMIDKLRNHILSGQCLSCSTILDTFGSRRFTAAVESDYVGSSNILAQDFILGKDIRIQKVAKSN